MNFLFYLEPLIIQDNPNLYSGWLPLWSQIINTLENADKGKNQYKMIIGQSLESAISQFNFLESIEIIPIPLESIVEQFNYSCMDASLAWFDSKYTNDQLENTSSFYSKMIGEWEPDVIISSSHIPFIKKLFPTTQIFYFEGGMTTRPPFPPSWYLDPEGLYKYSLLAKYSDEINQLKIDQAQKDSLNRYRNAFVNLINSKGVFSEFNNLFRNKFSQIILLPLQTDGFWFQGNCSFDTMFQLVHKLMSSIDPNIGVVVTPHPSNTWFTSDIVNYFENKFNNFIYLPEVIEVSSASQYLLQYVDAVISVSSMVGFQALIWNKKLFSIGETQLKVGAEYCFKPDLSDIDKLLKLLELPKTNKDGVLYWLLTNFYVPEHYFFNPDWLKSYILNFYNEKSSGYNKLAKFQQFDNPEKIFSVIIGDAILDIPRFRGREFEKPPSSFNEKVTQIKAMLGDSQNKSNNHWLSKFIRSYDEEICFITGETSSNLLINGWSQLEDWGVWSQENIVDILVSLPQNFGNDIKMLGVFQAFVNEKIEEQKVEIFVNDEKLDTWKFQFGNKIYKQKIIIPAKLFQKSTSQTHISFIISNPNSPASLGLSNDTRKLGISMHSLIFSLDKRKPINIFSLGKNHRIE